MERDFIPNIFVQRQNDEQPAADSYTAYQLYLEWRKDEGENGHPITKTFFTQKLKERNGPARRGKKNVQGKKRPVDAWFWDTPDLGPNPGRRIIALCTGVCYRPPLKKLTFGTSSTNA